MRNIFLIFIFSLNIIPAYSNIDSLLNSLDIDTGKVEFNTLIELSDEYFDIDSIFLSIKYGKKALFNANHRGDKVDYAEANYVIANIFYNYGDYTSAIDYYLISKTIFSKYSKFKKYSKILNSLAICYGNKKEYSKSLEYLNEMVYLNKNISYSKFGLATAYSNIGFVYYYIKKYNRAEEYYLKAIGINENVEDTTIVIDNYINLGLLYEKMNKNKLAEEYLYKALNKLFFIDKNEYKKAGAIYENLSLVSRNINNIEKRKEYLLKSLEYYKLSKKNTDISNAYANLADLYSVTDFKKAFFYLNKSLKIAKKINNNSILSNNYLLLSKIYENNNDIEKSFYYFKKYSVIQDSLYINIQTSKIDAIENINLLKENDYKFSLLEKENELNIIKVEKANQEIRVYSIIITISALLIIIIVVSLVIILKQLKLKKIHLSNIAAINNKISMQNLEIINQKEILVNTNNELKIANEYAEKLRDDAEKSSTYKSLFLANMSHEIRTPMNGIIGIADILQDCEMDDKAKEYAQIINSSANNLLTVINDILDYSKIESNQIILENLPIKLNNEVEEVIKMLKSKAEEKNLDLFVEYDNNIPEYIISDPVRIKQIITNIVNNALKFTKKGYVKVVVELFETTETNVIIKFKVIDTGIGIKEENLGIIFNDFTQADKSTTRKYGGTGLGLSIAKHLTELLYGTIGISSKEGEGSEFWFTITAGVFKDISGKIEIKNELNFNVKHQYNILIVEDDIVNIELLKTTLIKAKHTYMLAKNGLEALNIYKEKHNEIQLILMDLHMPIMDGYKAVDEMRKYEKGNSLKQTFIIAVTANAMQGEKEKCISAGMNDYISKPFKPKELINIIDNIDIFGVNN